MVDVHHTIDQLRDVVRKYVPRDEMPFFIEELRKINGNKSVMLVCFYLANALEKGLLE